jgi:hypothetical protein
LQRNDGCTLTSTNCNPDRRPDIDSDIVSDSDSDTGSVTAMPHLFFNRHTCFVRGPEPAEQL